jgi:hypothetical protein
VMVSQAGKNPMNYEIAYDPEKKIIYGRLYGFIDADVIFNVALELAQLIQRHDCYLFLNDAREASLTQSTNDVSSMPKIMAKAGVSLQCKRAFVIREITAESVLLQELAETSGHKLKIFTTIEEANDWLMAGE